MYSLITDVNGEELQSKVMTNSYTTALAIKNYETKKNAGSLQCTI